MGYLSQWVRLVHELAQRVSPEERVDDTRNGLCVDEVCRSENLIVTHVHALSDGTAHTGKTNRELVGELLTNSTHATVAQVVNIINRCIAIDQLDEILNNLNNIFFGKNTNI